MRLPAHLYASIAVPFSVGLFLQLMPLSASGQGPPQRITTDTPEYCLQLLDRISELVRTIEHPPQEATDLSAEGQRMCDQGQTLGGILRLRRALVLLRQKTASGQ
ncbi:MAG TPA: hypothetical protein VME47_01560 [Acetobacteraceae bacterium]|nr:hypothetical protein [Acetobacteraceae bacterium]